MTAVSHLLKVAKEKKRVYEWFINFYVLSIFDDDDDDVDDDAY